MRSLLPGSSSPAKEVVMASPVTLVGPALPLLPEPALLQRIREIELDGRTPEPIYIVNRQVLLIKENANWPDYPGAEENRLRFNVARMAKLSMVPTVELALNSEAANEQYILWNEMRRRAQAPTRRPTFADDNQLDAAAERRRTGRPEPPPEPPEEEEEPYDPPEEADEDF